MPQTDPVRSQQRTSGAVNRRFALARPRVALLAFAAAALIAAPAAAEGSPPEGAAEATLVFKAGSARLVGASALVKVRCLGPRSGLCNGTVTLSVAKRRNEVPFSVGGGNSQSIAVPVGRAGRLDGMIAVAVAKTAQPFGGSRTSARRLRLRA